MAKFDTPADVEHWVSVVQTTKWCNMSAFVMYLYEYLITFVEEVNFIWTGTFSPGKVLFVAIRYFTFVMLLFHNIILNLPEVSDGLCVAWVRHQWVMGSFVGFLAHLILELRIYVMFNKTKAILTLLIIVTVSVVGTMFFIVITILTKEGAEFVNLGSASNQHICLKTHIATTWCRIFWVPILSVEGFFLGIAFLKCLSTSGMTLHDFLSNRSTFVFLKFLIRDSVLFFFMVFATFLGTELVWLIAGNDYIEAPVSFAICSSSIWSQRLLLNIRKHREADEFVITIESTSMPTFADQETVLDTFRDMKAVSGRRSKMLPHQK